MELTRRKKGTFFVNIIFIVLIFWGMYTPIASIIGPTITTLIFLALDLILFVYIYLSKINMWQIFQKANIFNLIFWIFLATTYVGFRAAFSGNEARVFQNLQIVVQILYFSLILLILFYKLNYSKYDILKLFLDVVLIQALIAVAMLIFPSMHSIALKLYYAGGTENVFISAKRIYGLSSEYTFTTPIVNGLFGVIAVFMSLRYSKWIYIYILPILLLVLLNGRTGLIIFSIGACIVLLKNSVNIFKLLSLFIISVILLYVVFYILSIFSPDTYTWIGSFFTDTTNLLQGNPTGNYTELGMQYPIHNILFGYGFRIFNLNAIVSSIPIFQRSDIGYANDLFLGGIVYILLLYIPIFWYILSSTKMSKKFQYTGLPLVLLLTLIIADYKGETMRNGNLLLVVITLATLFRLPESGD